MHKSSTIKNFALDVINTEVAAVSAMEKSINEDFCRACELILATKGRIIVTGMGKSGHIANKIAATLASTGTPAFFVHPGEASHGDLGMITREDLVIGISNSGESNEIIAILPMLKRMSIPFISMTGKPSSKMASIADINLNTAVEKEACPHNLAPTSSTTATLVLGDALAITLLQLRGFSANDFALSHPGGSLGKRLLLSVGDLMRQGKDIPKVSADTPLNDALLEMSSKGLGMTTIVDADDHILGIYTDGDLRRSIEKGMIDGTTSIKQLMQNEYKSTNANMLAAEAVSLMEKNQITCLLVKDEHNTLTGALHMHDLLRAGVI